MAPAERKVTILFIQASPPAWTPLDANEEMRRLQMALRSARHRDRFDWRPLPAARVGELLPALRQHTPDVVHFAGHGDGHGGLVFNAEDTADEHILPADQWAEALRIYQSGAARTVRLIVLAGCHTAPAAELAAQHVDCAVGMADRVGDEVVTKAFTPALYRSLADGSSVHEAVEAARWQMRNSGLRGAEDDAEAVKLYVRPGVDARALKLTELAGQVFSDLHLAYLRRLFDQKWSTVSMSLFDPALGRRCGLLDIYVPLPVDFAITLRLGSRGRVVDWWCGRGDERPEQMLEAERLAEIEGMSPAERRRLKAGMERMPRPRTWADLKADEAALHPLLDLAQAEARQQRGGRGREERLFHWRADAHHAAQVQSRFVLVGDPGSGKSTFLRHLALCWAGEILRRAGDDDAPAAASLSSLPDLTRVYTPIYLELRDLVDRVFAALPADPAHSPALPGLAELRAYLRTTPLVAGDDALVEALCDLLREGDAALLLDGLDEVGQAGDPRRRAQIQAFVGELAEKFPNAPILITARPYAYREGEWALEGFGRTALAPLPPERQAALVGRLLGRLLGNDAPRQTEALVAALGRIPDDLRNNPLLLTLLTALWVRRKPGESELPSTRGELYRRALKLLLEGWVRTKVEGFSIEDNLKLSEDDLQLVLQLVACQAQEARSTADRPALIMEKDFYAALRAIGRGRLADDLLDHLERLAGMLLEAVEMGPGVLVATYEKLYRFLHPSFQEYLAACELLYREGDRRPYGLPVLPARRFPEALSVRVQRAPTLWANVLRMAVDELLYQKRSADAWELLSECCKPYRERREAPEAVLVALQVAEEARLFAQIPERRVRSFYEEFRDVAVLALTDYEHFTPEQRDIAGRLLGDGPRDNDGRLLWPPPGHDPRPGVGLRRDGLPDIAWVKIEDPQVPGTLEVPGTSSETFWIAKYPVTYAQYRAFLEAPDGFRNPQWWSGLGAPREHRERPGEQRFQYWNHPAENVSWYDAIAFCRWLTAQAREHPDLLPPDLDRGRDWKITLPTEWQWEKAARGRDGRMFPWGGKKLEDYQPGYANIDETGRLFGTKVGPHYLQKTSAVGMYPQAASPYGVLDMSGNVWEWCLTKYDQPDDPNPERGNEIRVLRGGSWGSSVEGAAASWRDRGYPYIRFDLFGFRVVVVRAST